MSACPRGARAGATPPSDFPVVVRNRMTKSRSYLLAEVIEGEPNAETRIERLRTFAGPADGGPGRGPGGMPDAAAPRPRVVPAGAALRKDPPAPGPHGLARTRDCERRVLSELLDKAPDDYTQAAPTPGPGIRFVDPITGSPVEYRSGLELSEAR